MKSSKYGFYLAKYKLGFGVKLLKSNLLSFFNTIDEIILITIKIDKNKAILIVNLFILKLKVNEFREVNDFKMT